MTYLRLVAKICFLAGLLAACGCYANHTILVRINTHTGKEDVPVHKGEVVQFIDQEGKTPAIRFRVKPPCEARDFDANTNELKEGVCHVNSNRSGLYVYDCGGACADPDMPIRSKTKPLVTGREKGVTPQPCFNRTILLQLPTTATPANDSIPAGMCVVWDSAIADNVTISNLMGSSCPLTPGTDGAVGPCDLAGATSPVTYTYSEGEGGSAISSTGKIALTGLTPPSGQQ